MDLMRTALGLPVQAVALVSRVNRSAAALLAAAEQVPALVARLDALLEMAEALVARAAGTAELAAQATSRVDEVRKDAAGVTRDVADLRRRADVLLTAVEPLVSTMSAVDPGLPAEASQLVRRALPLVTELDALMPLLREVLQVLTDVEMRFAGLPGAGLLRRRGERELDAVEDSQSP